MVDARTPDARMTDRVTTFALSIRFPVYLSVLLIVGGLLITSIYYYVTQDLDKSLVFIALVTAGFGQIGVSFYTARTLRAVVARDERDFDRQILADERIDRAEALSQDQLRYELKREALRFGMRWNDPAMFSARATLREIASHRGRPREELTAFIEKNKIAVYHVMNFLEEMATCCRHNVVDLDIMKSQFDYVVVSTWDILIVWIVETRQSSHPAVWEDTEWLCGQWRGP